MIFQHALIWFTKGPVLIFKSSTEKYALPLSGCCIWDGDSESTTVNKLLLENKMEDATASNFELPLEQCRMSMYPLTL